MTKEEFLTIIDVVDGAYPSFELSDKRVSTWFQFLGGFEKNVFMKVVLDYIKENPKPPAISDFYGRCEKITNLYSRPEDENDVDI